MLENIIFAIQSDNVVGPAERIEGETFILFLKFTEILSFQDTQCCFPIGKNTVFKLLK